ncbi:phage terminase small subunit P27 family [Brochothrix thermosphacta]|uniref:Phage terminase small subunit P27 family n=1 Tax=Brochothrix thermosphacta TaxID=2756 RepID=A0A291BUW5_BROTH|nr:phage terminase small subunit P27 family [Brochothrix thermosphacta]ATF25055.1 phage terminase small subunit P27 family [Brochothrix thermosphacta]
MANNKKLLSATSKNYTKEEIESKQEIENKLHAFEKLDSNIKPPHYLDTMGKNEWNRVVPLLQDLPISNLDYHLIAQYCNWYSVWRKSWQDVKKNKATLIEENSSGIKTKKINPDFTVMEKATTQLMRISNELGMTISSRMRLVDVSEDEEDDPFA